MSHLIEVYEKNERFNTQFEINIKLKNDTVFKRSLRGTERDAVFFNIESYYDLPETDIRRYKLSTNDYIGIFSFPNNPPVIIKSKVHNTKIFQMLRNIEPENYYIFDEIISGISEDLTFSDIIINMFFKILAKFLKRPLQKLYRLKFESLKNIKGKVLISETLKKTQFLQAKLVCEYETFTQNTVYNQIIKTTLYLLLFLTKDKKLLEVKHYLQYFNRVSYVPISERIFENLKYNHFTIRYKEIHNFCRMIIQHFSIGNYYGGFQCYSLLFNSNSIFERFIRNIIKEGLRKEEFKVYKYEDRRIQPDIVIEKRNTIMLICDTKYKLKYNLNDYRQMLDYVTTISHNIETEVEVNKLFPKKYRNSILIYPQIEKETSLKLDLREQRGRNGRYFTYFFDLNKINDKQYVSKWLETLKNEFLT